MRPLTAEEIQQAHIRAVRLWRGVWFRLFGLLAIPTFLIVLSLESYPDVAWPFLALLIVAALPSLLAVAWGHRRWRRELEADIKQGVVAEKTGRVYDRFRLWSVLGPPTYIVWAHSPNDGIDLHLGRSEFHSIKVGDTISVEYLPRSGLFLQVKN